MGLYLSVTGRAVQHPAFLKEGKHRNSRVLQPHLVHPPPWSVCSASQVSEVYCSVLWPLTTALARRCTSYIAQDEIGLTMRWGLVLLSTAEAHLIMGWKSPVPPPCLVIGRPGWEPKATVLPCVWSMIWEVTIPPRGIV